MEKIVEAVRSKCSAEEMNSNLSQLSVKGGYHVLLINNINIFFLTFVFIIVCFTVILEINIDRQVFNIWCFSQVEIRQRSTFS